MTDTTRPNGDRDRPFDREAALDRNYRPHRWDHLSACHCSGVMPTSRAAR